MQELSCKGFLLQKNGLDKVALEHLEAAELKMQEQLLAVSLWADGVPFSWDRNKSVEVVTWSLPGVAAKPWSNMRLLFSVLPSDCCGPRTMEGLLAVFTWSLQALFRGGAQRGAMMERAGSRKTTEEPKQLGNNLGSKLFSSLSGVTGRC